ncbi:MAG: hypothetical protein WCJ29_05340 [bacterium]
MKRSYLVGVLSTILVGVATYFVVVSMQKNVAAPFDQKTAIREIRGNGFSVTLPSNIMLAPNIDMKCQVDANLACEKNTDDSPWMYTLEEVDNGIANLVPITIEYLNLSEPAQKAKMKRIITSKPETKVVAFADYAHGIKAPGDEIPRTQITVIRYDEKGYFAGKGDLRHVILLPAFEDDTYYWDIQYMDDGNGSSAYIEQILKSFTLYFAN